MKSAHLSEGRADAATGRAPAPCPASVSDKRLAAAREGQSPKREHTPQSAYESSFGDGLSDTVVLATDLSEESRCVFAPVARLARRLGSRLVLLHVVREPIVAHVDLHGPALAPPLALPFDPAGQLREAKIELQDLAQGLGGDVEAEVLEGADIPMTIVSFAQGIHASYLALSTRGRTGLRRFLMGSVAEQILRHSKTPVVCFPLN